MSLKRQVASGFFWVTLAQLAGRGLSFVTTLILAKLLAPSMFGLVGMAGLAIAALQYFQDAGFDAALIYRRDEVDEASHTRSSSSSPPAWRSSWWHFWPRRWWASSSANQLWCRSCARWRSTIPISGFARVPYILLSRDLDFRRKIMPELLANIIGSGAVDRSGVRRRWASGAWCGGSLSAPGWRRCSSGS